MKSMGGEALSSNEILVIHDDQQTAQEINKIVSSSGFKAHLAKSKIEAIEISTITTLRTIIINALLTDTSIVALITELRKIPHLTKTPIIILTETDVMYNEILALSRDKAAYGLINPIKLPATEDDLLTLIESSVEGNSQTGTSNKSTDVLEAESWNGIDWEADASHVEDKPETVNEDGSDINSLKIEDEELIASFKSEVSKTEEHDTLKLDDEDMLMIEKPIDKTKTEPSLNVAAEKAESREINILTQSDPDVFLSETPPESIPSDLSPQDTNVETSLIDKPQETHEQNISYTPESIEKTFDSDKLELLSGDDSKKHAGLFKNKRVVYIGIIQILFVILAAIGAYMFFFKSNISITTIDNQKVLTVKKPETPTAIEDKTIKPPLTPQNEAPEGAVEVTEPIAQKDEDTKKPPESLTAKGTVNTKNDNSAKQENTQLNKNEPHKPLLTPAPIVSKEKPVVSQNKSEASQNKLEASHINTTPEKIISEKVASIKAIQEEKAAQLSKKEEPSQTKNTTSPAPIKQEANESAHPPAVHKKGTTYTAHIGIFSVRNNAEKSITKIKGLGFNNVYIKEEKHQKVMLYRVMAGPFTNTESAYDMMKQLKNKGIDSFIYKY